MTRNPLYILALVLLAMTLGCGADDQAAGPTASTPLPLAAPAGPASPSGLAAGPTAPTRLPLAAPAGAASPSGLASVPEPGDGPRATEPTSLTDGSISTVSVPESDSLQPTAASTGLIGQELPPGMSQQDVMNVLLDHDLLRGTPALATQNRCNPPL